MTNEVYAYAAFLCAMLAAIWAGMLQINSVPQLMQRQIRIERKLDCLLHRTPHFCFVPQATHARRHV